MSIHFPLHFHIGSSFATAQSGRTLIQDFCPLSDSIEWQLGQNYLRERGNRAFISDLWYSPKSLRLFSLKVPQ